jgi:CRP-like cAMP-binding protein
MKISSYKPDDVIITEGEIGDKFYILYKGEVAVSKG